MKKISKMLTIILLSATILLFFTGCYGIKKEDIEIIENSENITQTVVFRGAQAPYLRPVFKAKYQGKEQLFHIKTLQEEKMWGKAKILDEDASDIVLLDKKIKDGLFRKKYTIGSGSNNLLCFSKNGSYYGYEVEFNNWIPQYIGEFKIETDDLQDLYIDREENIGLVNPDYEVLNYGTFKLVWNSSVDYDYFYLVDSRKVHIYDGETAELYKTIEVDSDIYGVNYGASSDSSKGEQLLIAVKDGKQFKVLEEDIERKEEEK